MWKLWVSGEHSHSLYSCQGFYHDTISSYYRHSNIALLPTSCRRHTVIYHKFHTGIKTLQYPLDISATIYLTAMITSRHKFFHLRRVSFAHDVYLTG